MTVIATFTDFGLEGPYLGQMKAVIAAQASATPVIDLFVDAPAFDPFASAYLLAAYATTFPADAAFLCVVDPGVGGARDPVCARIDGRWFVGPDNGLLALCVRRATAVEAWRIDPDRTPGARLPLSTSFHGRDLFAPAAAALAVGAPPPGDPIDPARLDRADWPDDAARVVYVDRYGNAMTGLRADAVSRRLTLIVGQRRTSYRRTFADAPPGGPFWYENANGLIEIAWPSRSAAEALDIKIGAPVRMVTD